MCDALTEERLQMRELLVPADHRRADRPRWPWHRRHLLEPVGGDRALLSLHRDWWERLDRDGTACELVRGLTQKDLVRSGGRLQPGRRVDDVARDEAFRGRGVVRHNLAGVDPDAHRQRRAVARRNVRVELCEAVLHLGRRAQRAQRVVLMCARDAEHGHHGITDELLDDPAVPLHRRLHLIEVRSISS